MTDKTVVVPVELLPCPFCGELPETWGDTSQTFIRCGNDQCIIYSKALPYNDYCHKASAWTAWNTRSVVPAPMPPATQGMVLVNEQCLLGLTEQLPEHPYGWDGPCWCATCQSYAAEDAAPSSEGGGS